jgi:DNA polymerase-3 subunit epsilon
MECVLRWLDQPGVRLVEVHGVFTCPAGGAARFARLADAGPHGRAMVHAIEDTRGIRPVHRPARSVGAGAT